MRVVEKQEILGFKSRYACSDGRPHEWMQYLPDRAWTKGDLLDYFHARDNPEITFTGQISGGVLLVKKSQKAISFIEEFRDVFVNHFELVDDSPSISPNFPEFIENRHDQSVLSMIYKTHGLFSFSSCEHTPPSRKNAPAELRNSPDLGPRSFQELSRYPIHCRHDIATGWRSLVPIQCKPFLWKCIRALFG